MPTCVCRCGGVLKFEDDTKGLPLSIGAREAFGNKREAFEVSDPRAECAGPGLQKTTHGSRWSDPQVTRFLLSRVMT